MPFTGQGNLGATGSTANNQATLALTTAAQASVGELVVLVYADDNTASADGTDDVVASITDNSTGGPNNWQRAISFSNAQGAAQAGATVDIWWAVITKQINSGGTITATFTNATQSDATAVTARRFTFTGGSPAIEATNTLANDAADPGSLNATTANIECLRIRGIASEVGNNTSLTGTASWTVWANGNSATTGTTAEMCARAEHIISTGTGSASDPTYVTADHASAYVAFKLLPSLVFNPFPQQWMMVN